MKAISSLQQSTKSPMRKYQHPSVNVDKTKCQVSIREDIIVWAQQLMLKGH